MRKEVMTRPYVDWKNKWLWKRIDYDKAMGFQCLDLIKEYLDVCLWMWTIWTIGNANQCYSTLMSKYGFVKLPLKEIKQWDIIVKDDSKNGHIAIVDRSYWGKTFVLEQNGKWWGDWLWENAIRVKWYNCNWWSYLLRNDRITENYNKERWYVEEVLKERHELYINTKQYLDSLYYKYK